MEAKKYDENGIQLTNFNRFGTLPKRVKIKENPRGEGIASKRIHQLFNGFHQLKIDGNEVINSAQ